MNKPIKSYKAFDENMRCMGFQYEVGKEYDMNGDIQCCKSGFHACEFPMEVWNYYDMLTSRFAEVEQSGKISTEADSQIRFAKVGIVTWQKRISQMNII